LAPRTSAPKGLPGIGWTVMVDLMAMVDGLIGGCCSGGDR
jgi:hypothetical protein